MQIKIKAVNVSKPAGKKYSVAEVVYENERGDTKTWKLMDFANPATFNTLKEAQFGQQYDIYTEKDDKDYTQWRKATLVTDEVAPNTPATGKTVASTSRSTYETAEERARKQVLIVKQSCLAQAVALLVADRSLQETGESIPAHTVTELADHFVTWVLHAEDVEVNTDTE